MCIRDRIDSLGQGSSQEEAVLFKNREHVLRSALHVFACRHPTMSGVAHQVTAIARLACDATVNEALTFWILCLACEDWFPSLFSSPKSAHLEAEAVCDIIVSKLPPGAVSKLEASGLLYSEGGGSAFAAFVCGWLQTGLMGALPLPVALRVWDGIVVAGSEMLTRYVVALFVMSSDQLTECTSIDQVHAALQHTASTTNHRALTHTAMLGIGVLHAGDAAASRVYHRRQALCGGDFGLLFRARTTPLAVLRHHCSDSKTPSTVRLAATPGAVWSCCGDQPLRLHDTSLAVFTCSAGLPHAPIGTSAPNHDWSITAIARIGDEVWVGGDGGVVHRYSLFGGFIAPLQTGAWDCSSGVSAGVCLLTDWQRSAVVGCSEGSCTLWTFPDSESDPILGAVLSTKGRWKWKGATITNLNDLWVLAQEGVLVFREQDLWGEDKVQGEGEGVRVVDPFTSVSLAGGSECITRVVSELWVGSRSGSLYAIQERTLGIALVRQMPSAVQSVAVAGSQVWAGYLSGVVLAYDGETHAVLREFGGHVPVVALEPFWNRDAALLQVWIARADQTVQVRIAEVQSETTSASQSDVCHGSVQRPLAEVMTPLEETLAKATASTSAHAIQTLSRHGNTATNSLSQYLALSIGELTKRATGTVRSVMNQTPVSAPAPIRMPIASPQDVLEPEELDSYL
eukprot:TRINITY_DN25468_c0_g1_i3.p1 TRINITY_DN25468_c0_g1~~TRINITY_DN25468_c0_g1_i3.p1  ORF type:complete len:683 (+),score=132.60 TRINITY_DN25468_c0_g1_i3:181-2229(+)